VTIADIQEGPGEKYAAQLRADGFQCVIISHLINKPVKEE